MTSVRRQRIGGWLERRSYEQAVAPHTAGRAGEA